MWAALAGLAGSGGVTLSFLALDVAPVVVVAPVTGTNPLFTLVLAQIFIRRLERLSWRAVAGAVLVVIGVAIISLSRPGSG